MSPGHVLRKLSGGAVATAVVGLLASLGATARADDWSSRGLEPTHQRASAERSGPLFRAGHWGFTVPGGAGMVSSPAVADGIVVFGAMDATVRALRATDG